MCPRLLTPFLGLGIDSNSPRKSGFVFLEKEKKPVISHLEKATFQCGLRFLIHPSIMELLNHFSIALRQLMPNLWRIVISCMEILMVITEGDMIKLDEFIHLYRLKKSKEYGYYKLVP